MQVDEVLYGQTRWCLWLKGIPPAVLRGLPLVSDRVKGVRKHRAASTRAETRALASYPTLFGEIRQPTGKYLIVPRHTGEDRSTIPMIEAEPDVICGDANMMIADPSLYVFGILQSTMHMAWVRAVCGRLESRYRYSKGIVYNNFPWPKAPTDKQRQNIEAAAQVVLDAREEHASGSCLADLYDPEGTPPSLVAAHLALDRAVDTAYGKTSWKSESERVVFLFGMYEEITSMFATKGARRRAAV